MHHFMGCSQCLFSMWHLGTVALQHMLLAFLCLLMPCMSGQSYFAMHCMGRGPAKICSGPGHIAD